MSLTLSSAASSGTVIQQGATSAQEKAPLPNPLDLPDSAILNKAYLTHLKDDQECDTTVLYDLVSNVLSASAPISAATSLSSQTQIATITIFKPEFRELKIISCKMITTRGTAPCAHQTTLAILERLRGFSWDAKALITLAAFSLEYGEFWRLYRIPTTDVLGNSLKQLNQVQSRNAVTDITDVVKYMVEVLPFIKQWAQWYANDYDPEKVHSLSLATQEVLLVVYWTVATTVAATANLVGIITDYKLSSFKAKLENFVDKFKFHLGSCQSQIDKLFDYDTRLTASGKVRDIVGLLKLLIQDSGPEIPQIYEGTSLIKAGIDVFKQKHVLLFISSLDDIRDEIVLLNSLYKRLQENPQEEKRGYKKEDFKILWIPIVDKWNETSKKVFNDLRKEIKWHVLEYFSELPGIGILESKFKYNFEEKEPIVAVINPQGVIINENARHVIFEWGIEAFPFTKQDGENLKKKWSWLWKLIEKVDNKFSIEAFERRDSYVFIYGGNDNKWLQDFTIAIDKIQGHEHIKDADVIIERRQLAKEEPDRIPYFWIGIDAKKPKKKCQDEVDCEIQKAVESLLCLKKDPLGWVLLSKGHHIKLLGHGEPMLQTVVDFNIWKENVLEKDFDLAFKEYYDSKVKEIYARCNSYTSDVLATITCPNPSCGRVMEVTSVNYICCHRDNPNSCCI